MNFIVSFYEAIAPRCPKCFKIKIKYAIRSLQLKMPLSESEFSEERTSNILNYL